jgi:TfoX/Sxy family transcriptional regulator of competence genes
MAYSEDLAQRLRVLLKNRDVTERKMFGGLAFLMNGHMFCGVVKADLIVRLGEEAAASAFKRHALNA